MYPAKPDPNATASQPAAWTPAPPVTGMAPPPATGIPINVPSPVPVAASQWSSGLCDCSDDCGLCCLTCWCPCITLGRIAEIVDRGATSCGLAGSIYTALLCFTGCQWVYSCTYRAKMRAQHGLPDAGCCDCCVHFCCEPCARSASSTGSSSTADSTPTSAGTSTPRRWRRPTPPACTRRRRRGWAAKLLLASHIYMHPPGPARPAQLHHR